MTEGSTGECSSNSSSVIQGRRSKNPREIVEFPRPGEVSPRPSEVSPRPREVSPRPSEVSPRPSEVSPRPSEVSSRPGEVSPRPGEVSPRPGEVSSRPGEESPPPGDESPRPREVSPRPSEVSPRPSEVSPRPGEVSPRPGEVSPRPSEVSPRPGEVSPRPGEVSSRPEKVHHEIDVMIGQHKEPSWMDRVKLPYTNAVIHEALRLGNVIPLNIPRQTTKDVQLRGYRIPKGTTVIPSLTGVLFDGKHWKSPNSFNPNRYLAENGQFHQVDAHLPFSTGHRMCIGVNLAQMETFLFFTFLMQRFQFTAAAGDLPMNLDGVYGATLAPHPYRICAYLRK
ncbi:hypothetical protein chiPu_0020524 [Chiloscyllium punctatum]|uniref:Cytochrome P450 n=1 Tax=Chiloscyllium punctatum TaxID=137246 RepID=A0A401RGK1_CHIPU|nr:hypothetical protein [Chiloscyllium punctatum]